MRAEWFAPFITFAVCWLTLVLLLRRGRLPMDHPNARSLHSTPTPRIGGLGIMAGLGMGWQIVGGSNAWLLFAAAGALVAASALDDWRGLPIAWRFMAHAFVAAAYLYMAMSGNLGILALFVLWVGIIWMINLYNFMDGSDGLAGGMTLIGFGCYGLAAWLGGDAEMLLLNLCVAAAAAGFLLFNFHPAKIFLGDGGSVPLGFLAAAMGLTGWARGVWPGWFPLLVFSPFIVDATVTLLKRLIRGEKVWQAHRSHYYQRLVQMGWGHRKTALAEYLLMGAAGLSAVWAIKMEPPAQFGLIAVWAALYLVMMRVTDKRWSLYQTNTPQHE